MTYLAFVLYIEQAKEKITIVDQDQGKLELYMASHHKTLNKRPRLVLGALISYQVSDFKKMIEQSNIIADPIKLARYELLFLHQVLTACYYCIPVGIAVPHIFQLLFMVLQGAPCSEVGKKMIILFIFFHCGIFSPELMQQEKIINYLLSETLEDIFKAHYTITEHELTQWLHACINQHPQGEKLKIVLRGN